MHHLTHNLASLQNPGHKNTFVSQNFVLYPHMCPALVPSLY